jgi:hypothetical protein
MLETPIVLYTRCTENQVEDDYEGGRVLLQLIIEEHVKPAGLLGVNVVLGCETDKFMYQFPATRQEKQQRWFKVSIEEVDPLPRPVLVIENTAGDVLRPAPTPVPAKRVSSRRTKARS